MGGPTYASLNPGFDSNPSFNVVRSPQDVLFCPGEAEPMPVRIPHLGNSDVRVINVDCIKSAVMLAPDLQYGKKHNDGPELNRWYWMEKPGLKLLERMGVAQVLVPEE
ncbi:hypothetical protein C8F04DRAFT_179053 [Mycena alexandri]|uniref:Uncharacterized protein n=2 Tax=Mycena alexandri TaxID=1745969 RepID=A0AAD6WU16_9AGAR|nr:hypothetical protein C8F04DRAFT_179053 [Mycena alexandri]